ELERKRVCVVVGQSERVSPIRPILHVRDNRHVGGWLEDLVVADGNGKSLVGLVSGETQGSRNLHAAGEAAGERDKHCRRRRRTDRYRTNDRPGVFSDRGWSAYRKSGSLVIINRERHSGTYVTASRGGNRRYLRSVEDGIIHHRNIESGIALTGSD